jgi:hypothetical protein
MTTASAIKRLAVTEGRRRKRRVIGVSKLALVLAKVEMRRGFVAHGILHEFAMAVGAQVIALTLVNILADVIGIFVIKPLENLVKLQQMVAVIIQLFPVNRIDLGLNFEPHDIA